jgi:hypothetical protein
LQVRHKANAHKLHRAFHFHRQPFICIALISFLSFQYKSTSAQIKNAGNIISYKKIPGGIEGKTANGIFDVHVYNDNIVRVEFHRKKVFAIFLMR